MANPPSIITDGPTNDKRVPVTGDGSGVIVAARPNAGVEFIRPELLLRMSQYQLISDCLEGSLAVKARGQEYLPMIDAHIRTPENLARYNAMKTRAVFYGVAQNTLKGLLGQVFLVDPEVKVPTLLEPVLKDANGNGVPLIQLAQQVEEHVLSLGRAGILVDFPKTDGPTSLLDQQRGAVRPLISNYRPENIRNWRTITRNGKIILSLVVLRELHESNDDGFSAEFQIQYRVLRLVGNVYEQQIWRAPLGDDRADFVMVERIVPLDSRGQVLNEIPFTFVGADDNTASVAVPPMFALCDLNIHHYVNSAAHEEAVFYTGQATPVLTGLTKDWVDQVLKGEVRLGSLGAIMLPVGGNATLLEMKEKSAAFEAMQHKERQMVALGAKLVEQKQVQRTATEAGQEKSAEDSVLTTVTNNVSAAIRFALEWCAIFAGVTTVAADAQNERGITYELNTDFDIVAMGPDQAKVFIEAWQKDAIDFEEMRTGLDRANMTTKPAAEAKASIAKDRQADADFEKANAVDGQPFGGA